MKGLKNILLLLVLTMVVSTMSASASELRLTTTAPVGCDPIVLTKDPATDTVKGILDYTINPTFSVTTPSVETLSYAWTISGVPSGSTPSINPAQVIGINMPVVVTVTGSCGGVPAVADWLWTVDPQIKSISVDVETISFADATPGSEVSGNDAIVTNTGNVPVDVTVTPSAMSLTGHPNINAPEATPNSIPDLPVDSDEPVKFTLNVPADAYGGTYTGTVEFATS